jgi:hypothetical protein
MEEIRQLIHYDLDEQNRNRKIPHFLVLFNHYADKDLEKRGVPFAPNIIEAGKKHGIVLATTYQLYEKVKRVKSGEKREVIAKEISEEKWQFIGRI